MASNKLTLNIEVLLDDKPVALAFIREAVREKQERDQISTATPKVMYLCDHRACNRCSNGECNHTTDIRHAKNFKNVAGVFYERTGR